MKKIEILVIGRNKEIQETVVRLINDNPQWNGIGICPDEEAVDKIRHQHFDILLLTNGLEEAFEQNVCSLFRSCLPDISIIQHYGGGSGLLANEIWEALDKKSKKE